MLEFGFVTTYTECYKLFYLFIFFIVVYIILKVCGVRVGLYT